MTTYLMLIRRAYATKRAFSKAEERGWMEESLKSPGLQDGPPQIQICQFCLRVCILRREATSIGYLVRPFAHPI